MRRSGASTPKAGGSAKATYDDLRKEWLVAKRRYFWIAAAVMLTVVGLVTAVAAWLDTRVWWWLAGAFAGGAWAIWVAVRDSPPAAVESWLLGSWGEERTAKALRSLPREWTVRHDIQTDRGNIDHLVVGPGGIFVLETKNWNGQITVQGETALVGMPGARRADRREGVGRQARGLALATHERILASSRLNVFVTPIVVLWGDFPQRIVGDKPTFVAGDALVELLLSRPPQIPANRLEQVTATATSAWQ